MPLESFLLSWPPVGCRSLWQIPTPYQPSMPCPNGHIPHSPMVGSWRPGLRPPLPEAKKKMITISTRCASHLWVSKVRHVLCTPLILTARWEADGCVATTYMRRFAQGATCSHELSQDTHRMQALQVRCNHEKESSELTGDMY